MAEAVEENSNSTSSSMASMGMGSDPTWIRGLRLNPENFRYLQDMLINLAKSENVLNEYQRISCSICDRRFGYQHRGDPNLMICSSPCMAVADFQHRDHDVSVSRFAPGLGSSRGVRGPVVAASASTFSFNGIGTERNESRSGTAVPGTSRRSNREYDSELIAPRMNRTPDLVASDRFEFSAMANNLNGISGPSTVNRRSSNAAMDTIGFNIGAAFRHETSRNDSVDETDKIPKAGSLESDSVFKDSDIAVPSSSKNFSESGESFWLCKAASVSTASLASTSVVKNQNVSRKIQRKEESEPSLKSSAESVAGNSSLGALKTTWTMDEVKLSNSLRTSVPCYIQYGWSVTKFTIVAAEDTKKINALQRSVTEYCKNAPPMTRLPSVNEIVFGPYDNKSYYRARVRKVDVSSKIVYVVFLDYGDTAKLQLSDCVAPCPKIMKEHDIYGLVYTCTMAGTYPTDVTLPDELHKLLSEKLYIGSSVKRISSFKWEGDLFLDSVQFRTWADVLIPFLRTVKAERERARKLKDEEKSRKRSATDSGALLAKEDKQPVALVSSSASGGAPANEENLPKMLANAKLSTKLAGGAIVTVQYLWDYHTFTLVAKEDEAELENLKELVLKHGSNGPAMIRRPIIGELVVAPYDGQYYRGVVVSIKDDKANIRFVDFGDTAQVKLPDLKEVTPEIYAHPIYGLVFKLSGVPAVLPHLKLNEIEENALGGDCQIELLDKETDWIWKGNLWVAQDRTWNDMIMAAISRAPEDPSTSEGIFFDAA